MAGLPLVHRVLQFSLSLLYSLADRFNDTQECKTIPKSLGWALYICPQTAVNISVHLMSGSPPTNIAMDRTTWRSVTSRGSSDSLPSLLLQILFVRTFLWFLTSFLNAVYLEYLFLFWKIRFVLNAAQSFAKTQIPFFYFSFLLYVALWYLCCWGWASGDKVSFLLEEYLSADQEVKLLFTFLFGSYVYSPSLLMDGR